jgi:hypothetical protein
VIYFLSFWIEGETVSARDESLQKAALDDAVVIVDTEEGDENSVVEPFFFLGPSLISFVVGSYDESSQLRAICFRNS